MHISELPRKQFEGFQVVFSYDSTAYYDVKMRAGQNVFVLEFVRAPQPREKKEWAGALFSPQWEDPRAYGLFDGRDMRALMEVTPERGTNRLRITSLCVQEGFRRRGYGALLLTRAKEIARGARCRAVMLETQSCNTAAVQFCLSQGLTLMGFDACAYSNEDLTRHSVRLDMGCLIG